MSASISAATTTTKKKKKHFLERTDPTFVQDLKDSVKHVYKTTGELNEQFGPTTLPQKLHMQPMKTTIRPDVKKRKRYTDKGDVKMTWISEHGFPCEAMVEFKRRTRQVFQTLDEFRYPTVIVDTLKNFERIRGRGDTLGYVVTDGSTKCVFFVDVNTLEANYVTKSGICHDRPYTWICLPKELFVEGIENVATRLASLAKNFSDPCPTQIQTLELEKIRRRIRLHRKREKELIRETQTIHQLIQKFQEQETTLLEHASPPATPHHPIKYNLRNRPNRTKPNRATVKFRNFKPKFPQ